MMIPIYVTKSVVGGHFVSFFVKSIKLRSTSGLQGLPARTFAPPAEGRGAEFHLFGTLILLFQMVRSAGVKWGVTEAVRMGSSE